MSTKVIFEGLQQLIVLLLLNRCLLGRLDHLKSVRFIRNPCYWIHSVLTSSKV